MFKTMIANIVAKNMKKKLQNATIQEADLNEVLKQIRKNLLEADVNLGVVKRFLQQIRLKALNRIIEPHENASDVLLLIIQNELTIILGEKTQMVDFDQVKKIMLVGLQGSGKTTTAAKLAAFAKNKHTKNPLLVAGDLYRLAAVEQLVTLSEKIQVACYQNQTVSPTEVVTLALKEAKKKGHDLVIIDTAGRLHTNAALMQELKTVKKIAQPQEILLVVDAMSGQDIAYVAQEFHQVLNLTGIIITKLDSDARAGAALSLAALLQVPIKFSGVGEGVNALDVFHPDRIAKKILGLGDLVTLAEKASEKIDEKTFKKGLFRMLSGKLDLEDLLQQMEQMAKVGSLRSIASMLPSNLQLTDYKIDNIEEKMRV